MKAKKRITAIVMALVMMLAVQPMYGNVALAAIAITGSDEFSAVSDNTEYTIENNTSCTSISITGSGNVLKVSGVNRIGGRVSGGFTFKLVEADWSSSEPMLSLDSFEEQTSFDVSGLTFTNITGIESGSRKTLIYSRSDVGGKIRSLDRSTNGVTNVTVPGIGIANNGVKMSLDLLFP